MPQVLPEAAFKLSGDGSVSLSLHIQPGAKRSGVSGAYGERIKIAVASPPVDGKANSALLKFLSEVLRCSKSSLNLVSGLTGRDKTVSVQGIELSILKQKLESISK